MRIFLGVVVAAGIALVAFWWWVTRLPPDRSDLGNVSQVWRDEHSRERRD